MPRPFPLDTTACSLVSSGGKSWESVGGFCPARREPRPGWESGAAWGSSSGAAKKLPESPSALRRSAAARQADRDRKKALVELLAADRRNFAAIRQARLVRTRRAASRPREVHGEEVQTYAIAS